MSAQFGKPGTRCVHGEHTVHDERRKEKKSKIMKFLAEFNYQLMQLELEKSDRQRLFRRALVIWHY